MTGRRLLLVSDFNDAILAGCLRRDLATTDRTVEAAPFGTALPTLIDLAQQEGASDEVVVWTRPERILDGFNRAMRFEVVDRQAVFDEAEQFASILCSVADRARVVLVAAWAYPAGYRGWGALDYDSEVGLRRLVLDLNLLLAERLDARQNVYLLDAERWLRAGGGDAASPKMWYASKVPYSSAVTEAAAADIRAALEAYEGRTRKVLVLDLDNTMWGGIVGEVGWENVRLGGHDYLGEAYVDFQEQLKALTRRGVQLAIVSKNDEETALAVIDRHPEMRLRRADFAAWRINWRDKAQNILDVAEELRLGLDSMVFVDDSPFERGRIADALPEVLVPDWPSDPCRQVEALQRLTCFDLAAVSAEDRARSEMYSAERARREAEARMPSAADWLASLETRVVVEEPSAANLKRIAQLFGKTNQMNLRTRRLSEVDIRRWLDDPDHRLFAFRVTDRFGDSGLVGVLGLDTAGGRASVSDFIMSCRVMGRGVEQSMLHVAVTEASAARADQVVAEYLPTERNGPCLQFWQGASNFSRDSGTVFSWPTEREYEVPPYVTLVWPATAGADAA